MQFGRKAVGEGVKFEDDANLDHKLFVVCIDLFVGTTESIVSGFVYRLLLDSNQLIGL